MYALPLITLILTCVVCPRDHATNRELRVQHLPAFWSRVPRSVILQSGNPCFCSRSFESFGQVVISCWRRLLLGRRTIHETHPSCSSPPQVLAGAGLSLSQTRPTASNFKAILFLHSMCLCCGELTGRLNEITMSGRPFTLGSLLQVLDCL